MRDLYKLADFGVNVLPRPEWPEFFAKSVEPKPGKCPPHTKLYTVQTSVDADAVKRKMARIGSKKHEPSAVKLIECGGRVWIADGHHSFVAYLLSGVPPKCVYLSAYKPGDSGKPRKIPAPHLHPKT